MIRLALALAVAGLLAAAPAASGNHSELLARWHLDTASGGFTPDDSGHGLNGEVNGGSAIVGGGRFGNAADFPGPGDSQIDVVDSTTLEPARVTVLAWVKLGTTPTGTHYVVAKGAQGCSGSSYALTTPGGGLAFHVYNGAAQQVSPNAGSGVWNDQWHAVAGTFDGATVRLYVDGAQVGSGTPAATSIAYGLTEDGLRIGNYPASNLCGGGLVFQGLVDEARIYNRALDAEEIAWLSAGSHAQPPNLPPPPVNRTAPAIPNASADPHPGDELTSGAGTWSGSPTSYAYQWLRCGADGSGCADIGGATGATYRLAEADLGRSIRLRVRATNAGGTSGPADSVATKPVTPVPQPLVARLTVSPNPSCVGSDTTLDARGSTGAIASYRFSVTEMRWGGFVRGYEPFTFVVQNGASPTANWVPYWNTNSKEASIVPNPFSSARLGRGNADVTLIVTDTRGTTAQAVVRENFVQEISTQPRTGCPPLAPVPLTPWSVADALKTVRVSRTAVTMSVPCATAPTCLGTLAVTYSGSLARATAKRRRPAVLAVTAFNVAAGQSGKVTARLTSRARRLVRSRKRLRARVQIQTADALGKTVKRSKRIVLRRR